MVIMDAPTNEIDTFVKSYRKVAESVLLGELNFEEFGLLQFLLLLANPFNGTIVTNYSDLANRLRLKCDRVRYLCEKLKAKKKIGYELRQGQKELTKFYVNGFPLASGSYINIDNLHSEVNSQIPKSKNEETITIPRGNKNTVGLISEVPNKEKDKENNKKHIDVLVNKVLKEDNQPLNYRPMIKKIAAWMHYPVFKPQKSIEETEAILGFWVDKVGFDVVANAFNVAAKGANPSVKEFWSILKQKEMKKKNETSNAN